VDPEQILAEAAAELRRAGRRFAVVGGLAVSIRGEVRFTRDVDLAVVVTDDHDAERLVRTFRAAGYEPIALVEQEARGRIATVRLAHPSGVPVDLLFSSSGIEHEVVERATPVRMGRAGELPVARAEELLALKVLSMTERRLQDRIDAANLILANPTLDLDAVRANLVAVTARGYEREQDLGAKLEALLADVGAG
jgi:hypothetical protein